MEKLKTNTHAHTQRAIYAKTHIQCQQMKIYWRMLYNYFIYLFIYYLFINVLLFQECFKFPGEGLGETKLNEEEVDCELGRRRYIVNHLYIIFYSR